MVFDTLYLLLSFGHETVEEAEKLDPPFSYFRIRLVCSLLETCGQFFNKGLAKKRLDRFLVFFQRYLLAKPPLPLDIEFDVQVHTLSAGNSMPGCHAPAAWARHAMSSYSKITVLKPISAYVWHDASLHVLLLCLLFRYMG